MPEATQQQEIHASSVPRNIVLLFTLQIIARLLNFVGSVILANYLGSQLFGVYTYAIALTTLFVPLSDLGMDMYLFREVPRNSPHDTSRLFGIVLFSKASVSLAVFLLVAVASAVLESSASEHFVNILLASIAVLLRAYWSTFSSLLRGIDRVSNEVVLFSASRMVEFIGIIVSLVIGGSLTVVIILIIGCNCLTILGTLLLVRKVFVKPSFRFDTQSIRTAVREGFPFALASIFTAIYFNVDTVLLSKFIDAKTAGVYRAAYNLVLPLMMVTSAVAAAVFPYVSQQYKTNKEQVTHIFRRAVSLLLLLALPTAVITTFLAPEIISFLFAPEYGAASSSLALLIWFLPFAYVTNLYGHTLGAMDDQPFVIRVNAVNAAFNLAANLIFIPFFAQTAAAATTVLTEILGFSILSVRIRRYFPAVVEPLLLLKIFFALMLTVPFLVFHPPMNVLIALALALLNYAIALLLVKAITLKDLREILFLMKPPQQEQ